MKIENSNVKIIIATHKKYWMPKDKMYLPVQVGAAARKSIDKKVDDLGYTKDDVGDNISTKNPYYCELTGLYWAWKNLDCEYLGLVHYRRHFSIKNVLQIRMNGKKESVLTRKQLNFLLKKYDVIVPKARHYYIENLYSHYSHTHYAEHLDKTREIINKICPAYLASYDKVMKQTYGYMFNMFIMKKEIADQYCEWLFEILERLETAVDYKNYDAYQGRLFGRVSELLFNVWLDKNIKYVKTLKTIHMEKINWLIKGKAFLNAKFKNKKFQGSF